MGLRRGIAMFFRESGGLGMSGFSTRWAALLAGPWGPGQGVPLLRRFSRPRIDGRAIRRIATAAFAAPTLIAILYYGVIASDRYVSQADFVVRGMSTRRATGLDMLFQTFGISRAVDDTNAVQQYMLSRDAVRALEARLPLREIFSNRKGDIFARFPYFWQMFHRDAFERLYDYYLDHVTVIQDASKGITTLKVVTFDAAQSQRVATTLLRLAEEMVNRMNERAQNDAVRSARNDVGLAEQRLIKAQLDLTSFRNKELLLDPTRSSISVLETITNLSTELTHTLALIQETGKTAPNNPALEVWRTKTVALQNQIDKERAKIAGRDGALAPKVADFESLSLARVLAERGLGAATASLEAARQEARRQQIYVEEIVSPDLPDEAGEPRRLRSVATVIVLTLSIAAISWILTVGAKEHAH
jgi:capsular polysaccharide transport system permease protein